MILCCFKVLIRGPTTYDCLYTVEQAWKTGIEKSGIVIMTVERVNIHPNQIDRLLNADENNCPLLSISA